MSSLAAWPSAIHAYFVLDALNCKEMTGEALMDRHSCLPTEHHYLKKTLQMGL